jgi:hypothetical protein
MDKIELPLHSGFAPNWLLERMKRLSGVVLEYMLEEFSVAEIFAKFSNPLWFQGFGCFLGFDWHSSGLTTTLTAAIKKACKERNLPIVIVGGKGKTALSTPSELEKMEKLKGINSDKFKNISRVLSKIDNSCVQDGYFLYHHTLWIETKGENWICVQQGMNPSTKKARRYHYFSRKIKNFEEEPHSGIITESFEKKVLNLVSEENRKLRSSILNFLREDKDLESFIYRLPDRHFIDIKKDVLKEKLSLIRLENYKKGISNFKDILLIKGIGPKTLRALTLLAHLIYDTPVSFKDPARFSFAHGGKDGYPYRINKIEYDRTIEVLEKILVYKKGFGREEREFLLKKLYFLKI